LNPVEAAVLGIVQGLKEFFPVSSSGHLAIFQALFGGREGGGLLFEVAVHVATLVAIALFYRARIAALVLGTLRRDRAALDYVARLAVATLPAVAVGLGARDAVEAQFSNGIVVGAALLVTGVIVFSTRWTAPQATLAIPGWGAVLLIGIAQAFAVLPGISRSGSTVAMALALGIAPRAAAEFSFLLGIIAIAGAAVLTLPELGAADASMLWAIGIGGFAALVSGLTAIWIFVRMLDRSVFHHWAWYCWVVGLAFLVWQGLA
jgi:undecaprenyl-diphosphatase